MFYAAFINTEHFFCQDQILSKMNEDFMNELLSLILLGVWFVTFLYNALF